MSKILIIGAAGKIGTLLTTQLSTSNEAIVAMVKDKSACDFPQNIEVIEADLEADFSHALTACSTVVFTAGSGAHTGCDKTLLVDLWGAVKAIDAAKLQRVKHFIIVSARNAGNPELGPSAIKPYLIAKHFADQYLVNSGLNYTILRPGRLTDEIGIGLIRTTRPAEASQQLISRQDTANSIAHCINNASTLGKIYELYTGEQKIEEALT